MVFVLEYTVGVRGVCTRVDTIGSQWLPVLYSTIIYWLA